MKKKHYDVVVVGCGPGGAVAGKFAALNGAETLIIEQKRQIGFPVHDSMGIVYSKSEVEETTLEPIAPAMVYSKAEGLRYLSASGKEGKPLLLPDSLFINRQLFDKSLATGAVRAGAEILLHTRVVGVVSERGVAKGVVIKSGSGVVIVPCSLVIAADGSCEHVARLAGMQPPNRWASVALGCEFAGVKPLGRPHNIDEIHMDPSEGLYRYVAPYTEDRFSIGCSVPRDILKRKKGLKPRLAELLGHLEAIGKYGFSKASPVNMMTATHATIGISVTRKLAADGIILVGDAAGEPLFGSRWGAAGMFRACWSGRVAGEMAARAVKKRDVSGTSLDAEYKAALATSFKEGQREKVLAAHSAWSKILTLAPEDQERAVEEIGWEIAALHFHSKGGVAAPLLSCLEPAQKWLMERGEKA